MHAVRILAVINQKGGVGKTTTVANLGAAVAASGRDICVVDLDAQTHLTLHLGIEPGTPSASIYDVLVCDAPLASVVLPIAPHLWLVPSVIDLAGGEIELVGMVRREQILRDRIGAANLPYEFLLIDCPPSLGLLTLNARAAADEVIIPLQPHFLALQGLGKLLETVSLVRRRINPKLRVGGVVLCMYESTTRLAAEVVADLRGFFDAARGAAVPWAEARIFQTVIRRNVKLAESPSHGKTIFDYEPHSNGAADYRALADEFLTCYPAPADNVPAGATLAPSASMDPSPDAPADTGVQPVAAGALPSLSLQTEQPQPQ